MNKNILILSPTPSHPQDAGNRKRIFALTKYLQELGATIYFVYCPREWEREIPKNAYDGMNQCWDYFFVAYPVQAAVHRTDDEYFELDAWWDVGIEFAVNWIKLSVDFDMVLCNYVFYSKVLELFDSNVTKVIDTHDIVSNRNYLLDKKLGYRDFFYVSPESEKKALDRAHLVLSIKEDESSWFKCLSKTPVVTIGHLEPEPSAIECSPRSAIANQDNDYGNITLGFIGSANPINVRNLESFLDEYLTAYKQYSDKLTFIVGGKVCDALNVRFQDRVKIIGKVNEVSEFYELVNIVVLPFEFSTGLKIKTVEALSWSKPCIGTINAFEGLGSSSKYHSYRTIKELAWGIEEIISEPQITLPQLQQDSKFVYLHYTRGVKQAIEKLYKVDWKLVKKIQANLTLDISEEINSEEITPKKSYSFKIITNVDFWNTRTNEELWLDFWINHAQELGTVDIYRTKNFDNLEADKLKLYKLGLVDHVHHRELYQIVDFLRANHQENENQILVSLLDFNSIIFDRACFGELENLQLASNHFLFYFFHKLSIVSNEVIRENVCQFTHEEYHDCHSFYIWDLDVNSIVNQPTKQPEYKNILLSENPIMLKQKKHCLDNLEQIVIGISCLNSDNQAELNKFLLFYQDFLPQHFKLVIFSDLKLNTRFSIATYSLKNAIDSIHTVDLFVCIEEPQSISFLLYLCICEHIPIYSKSKEFASNSFVQLIENFTSIPKAYQLFIEKSIFSAQADSNSVFHSSWRLFLEYWLKKVENDSRISASDSPLTVIPL